jgi:hypothetical protein
VQFGNDDWRRLDPDWRRWIALLCVAPERALDRFAIYYYREETERLLGRSWASLDQLSEAQLQAVRRVLRATERVVIGSVYDGDWRSESLQPLRHFSNLHELDLQRVWTLPSDPPFIATLTSLTKLRLEVYADTLQDRFDLRPLAALTGLRSLQTRSMPLLGLDALAELTQLRELWLEQRGVAAPLATEPSRLPFERLRKLEHLVVRGRLGSLTIQPHELAQLGQLQALELSDSPRAPIHEAAALAELTQLRRLHLCDTELCTLAGLIDAPLEHLEQLNVTTRVPEGEVRSFSAAHPRCEVYWTQVSEEPVGGCYRAGARER